MSVDHDTLWADLLQFDPPSADRVWEGDLRDPDAPGWYASLGSLIHQARGPAEADELVDEPAVVATMRRASLGAAIVALPHHRGVRSVGRVVAMKAAAAATTASMVGVAAAATTGIVATVAATVVVPAFNEKVRPVIEHVVPVEATELPAPASSARPTAGADCRPQSDHCLDPSSPVVVELAPATPAAPSAAAAAPTVVAPAPAASGSVEPDVPAAAPVVEAPVEPAPAEPAPVEPAPVETAGRPARSPRRPNRPSAEPPPAEPTIAEPPPAVEPTIADPPAPDPPAADPAPVEPPAGKSEAGKSDVSPAPVDPPTAEQAPDVPDMPDVPDARGVDPGSNGAEHGQGQGQGQGQGSGPRPRPRPRPGSGARRQVVRHTARRDRRGGPARRLTAVDSFPPPVQRARPRSFMHDLGAAAAP